MRAIKHMLVLSLAVGVTGACFDEAVTPPADGVVEAAVLPGDNFLINVTSHGANGDDNADDTAAIRAAIEVILQNRRDNPVSNWTTYTLYFPRGTYRVSGRLTFGSETKDNTGGKPHPFAKNIHIVGQSRDGTVIRLADGTFTGDTPQAVLSLFDGQSSNNAFNNTVEDLTIDVGNNNGAAIGLNYHNNNMGAIRRVTIRSRDNQGHAGLVLGAQLAGMGTVRNVKVKGFKYGIVNTGGHKMGYVLEHLVLEDQTGAGILTQSKMLAIRGLQSRNSVPALVQAAASNFPGDSGQVVILDSRLEEGAAGQPAINNVKGWIFARDVTTTGYGTVLRDHEQAADFGDDGEYVRGGVSFLWDDVPRRSLGLTPIEETPDAPNDPRASWTIIDPDDQVDDGAAIQQAINTGATTIFLKRGTYTVKNTIVIKNALHRLAGNWSEINVAAPLVSSEAPLFRFENGTADVVVLEALTGTGDGAKQGHVFQNDTTRSVVLRDLNFMQFDGVYRNGVDNGRVFIDNVNGGSKGHGFAVSDTPGWLFKNQSVWARQLDSEGNLPRFLNDGGSLWVLGFKAGEGRGPYFETINGGQTEILGGLMNNLGEASNGEPAFKVSGGSRLSVTAMETANSSHPVMIRETRNGTPRELGNATLPTRQDGRVGQAKVIPLFRAGQ